VNAKIRQCTPLGDFRPQDPLNFAPFNLWLLATPLMTEITKHSYKKNLRKKNCARKHVRCASFLCHSVGYFVYGQCMLTIPSKYSAFFYFLINIRTNRWAGSVCAVQSMQCVISSFARRYGWMTLLLTWRWLIPCSQAGRATTHSANNRWSCDVVGRRHGTKFNV